ncbi:MAG: hypothetical protein KGJ23_04235 [Euryarchaeota archaeon]|nr:hypothetical protein [Euryarchaeota archaeon]MDE1835808.1 hypothetical protein [Euryarchaeota archaeon]MDE1880718.1 hypothetical protein [Euryarchaeota archaeon]MDE2043999.1 hypothetical protein [Thermoplasmata archaeon]
MSHVASVLQLSAGSIPKTPLQYTQFLLWTVFLMALAVGIVYVFLLLWTLSKHLSHEPLARDRPLTPPRSPKPPASR